MTMFPAINGSPGICRLYTPVEDLASYFVDRQDSYVHLWTKICNLDERLHRLCPQQPAQQAFVDLGWKSYVCPTDAQGPFPKIYSATWPVRGTGVYCYGYAEHDFGVVFPPSPVPAGDFMLARRDWAHTARTVYHAYRRP